MAKKITKNDFKEAITNTFGCITTIAKRLQVSRTGLYKFLDRNPELKSLIEDEKEFLLDVAESKLFEKVINGDLSAIKYLLDNKGRGRGYGQQQYQDKTEQTDIFKDADKFLREVRALEQQENKLKIINS